MSHAALPAGIQLIERGWLSSNSVLLHGHAPDVGAVLVDTGYVSHLAQTVALVDAALSGAPLRLIVNTHLHSDHCGGNAALAARHGCPVHIPPGLFDAVQDWDEARLSYLATGQQCPPFHPDAMLRPGELLTQGGCEWQIHAAPGHDPDAVLLFEPHHRVLLSADALWGNGFGIVFPELDGASAFDEVQASLDLIERLAPAIVVPGHGPAFSDVGAALSRARNRLAYFRAQPLSHARHAAKALSMFHMLEVQRCTRAELLNWLATTPVQRQMWTRFFQDQPFADWNTGLVDELVDSGLLLTREQAGGGALLSLPAAARA
ncbi:MBL fold metallo-hydrolase [Pelomonas sp. CA6]|uniref:MBL fold metallo-hydrolase n=1 Tax=Pelomonas sp. CA6 TaxID=2907999 RepID=UPI001F4C4181|nr:MBL fold metallo-hydrolase [Pelomonas sp. CA6]MCH7344725.1 MBL fold metallo-hydrolase [Pelomonas sp. CA6]